MKDLLGVHAIGEGDEDSDASHHIVGDKGDGGEKPVAQKGVALGIGTAGHRVDGHKEEGANGEGQFVAMKFVS